MLKVLDNQLAANVFAEKAVVEEMAISTNNAIIDRRVLVVLFDLGELDELIILFETPVLLFFATYSRSAGAIHGENFLVPLHVERTWLYGLPKGDE